MKIIHITLSFSSLFLLHGFSQEAPTVSSVSDDGAAVADRLALDPRVETWAPGTVRVEGVVYDSQEGDPLMMRARLRLVKDGKRHPFIVDSETETLSSEQLRELLDIIEGDFKKVPGAGCYIPHHGFIFYDAEGLIVAYLEACLLCGGGGGKPNNGIAETLSIRGPNEKLGPFLASLGLPVFETLGEWHDYFARNKMVELGGADKPRNAAVCP